ncbi:hypothetical protein [Aneurinibacillus sp. REN35]|uniref:hypothetical protein n=1 Tax=Aneurinibacillus sp. REN35 TaxID=3237286 RepID=UPI003527E6E2
MSQQYSVVFVNHSSNSGSACVFQQDPNLATHNAMSLAWFTKFNYPNTKVLFKWNIDYSFVWSETGVLVPGVQFIANEVLPADLTKNNSVTLSHEGGAYTFTNQKTASSSAGSLVINEDGTIPLKQASVGIGMSGNGTFAVQAQPNQILTFTPHPKYYIAFGSFSEGEVLDIDQMSQSAEIAFQPNVYSMTAILNQDNSWTIQPTSAVNKEVAEARELQERL